MSKLSYDDDTTAPVHDVITRYHVNGYIQYRACFLSSRVVIVAQKRHHYYSMMCGVAQGYTLREVRERMSAILLLEVEIERQRRICNITGNARNGDDPNFLRLWIEMPNLLSVSGTCKTLIDGIDLS